MNKNLMKFTLVIVSVYLLIQIYLMFGTWFSGVIGMLFFITLPFIVGYFVSYMIAPGLTFLGRKLRLPPSVVLTVLLLLIISLITVVSTTFFPQIINQFMNISTALMNASDTNTQRINELFMRVGIDLESQLSFSQIVKNGVQFFTSNSSIITGLTSRIFSSLLSVGSFLLFFILTLFYTIDKIQEKSKIRLTSLKEKGYIAFAQLLERIDQIFRLYFRGVFVSMVFVSVGSSIGFSILGLPNPIGLGIICGLFNVVPLVGPYIGAFPAAFVALSHGWMPLLYVLLVVLIVQQIEGNFVAPNIQGKFLDIQPLSILIGIVVFGSLFGIIGMVFAAPLSATLKVILVYIYTKKETIKKYWDVIVHSS